LVLSNESILLIFQSLQITKTFAIKIDPHKKSCPTLRIGQKQCATDDEALREWGKNPHKQKYSFG
jgi:hypothetical protein